MSTNNTINKTALVTGANRGIGLQFVQQLLKSGYHVIATCREPHNASELHSLKEKGLSIDIYPLDVTNETDLTKLIAYIGDKPIDRLILSAGIYGERDVTVGNINVDNLKQVFTTNAVAPLKVAEQLLKNVSQSQEKLIVCITSRMGSIADNDSGKAYAYRGSKAALNAMMRSLAIDVKDQAKVLLLHPGWVKTNMGGNNALIDSQTSVAGLLKIMDNKNQYETGSFLHYQGDPLPW